MATGAKRRHDMSHAQAWNFSQVPAALARLMRDSSMSAGCGASAAMQPATRHLPYTAAS